MGISASRSSYKTDAWILKSSINLYRGLDFREMTISISTSEGIKFSQSISNIWIILHPFQRNLMAQLFHRAASTASFSHTERQIHLLLMSTSRSNFSYNKIHDESGMSISSIYDTSGLKTYDLGLVSVSFSVNIMIGFYDSAATEIWTHQSSNIHTAPLSTKGW